MKQIAVFSDVHANLPALEAVLEDIAQRNIQEVYCLGDLVDFAPWGNEVIEVIRSRGIPCLMGNHDERIAFGHPVIPLPHHDETETAHRQTAIAYSKECITPANKEWLATLPKQISFTHEGYRVQLVHGSTRSNEEYIYVNHPEEDLEKMFRDVQADTIIMGHTHLSYHRITRNGYHAVNCGAVGRSKEADRAATYSIISLTAEGPTIKIVKLPYDNIQVANAIYQSKIPDFYGHFLLGK
ncbi:putative phosphoesterase [Chitinophaga dinghuensis]|uniref:Putative phosphoesterase n=1 Tax=Chitinophaga dinghuensis TaxID=1539050 RepID=A0A327VIQ7_9BACT|nr:metallophosphoesterase family protein [Chitinophaga dinghuensis]RAJ73744.1 putative phosphoesterase [Chitinophaga dinghuensis]